MELLAFGLFLFGCLKYFAASETQVKALYEMRMMLNDNLGVLKDWNDNQVTPCYFGNVICNQDNQVIEITLSSSGLSGVLSPSIAKLTTLHHLLLDGNSITGGIPQELGNLPYITTLNLGGNNLNGSIPASLGLLSELKNLNLRRNNLSGSIPFSLGSLQELENMDLSGNILSGEIPRSFSILPSLNNINLANNHLSGEIPLQLFQVAKYNFAANHLNCGQNSTSCEGSNGNNNSGHKTKLWIAMTVVPLVAALFCFIFCFRWVRRHMKGEVSLRYRSKVNEHRHEELVWGIEGRSSEFTFFDFSQVLEATSNFSDENKLGQGGFGPVYKGQFPDTLEVAVKRLASHSGQGFTEFKNEIQLIAKLQHRNLVRLLGCCSQEQDKMLVYEYLPNKSLDFFIFGIASNYSKVHILYYF